MAQWLSTEYVKALLEVTPAELEQFIQFFRNENFHTEVKVCENGDREVVVADDTDEIPLSFKKLEPYYEFSGSYQIFNEKLACAMRKAMKQFRVYAIVRRVYTGFKMTYYYENGTVVKIVENSGIRERVIYEYSNFNGQLEWIYRNKGAEQEIDVIKSEIDQLLDQRNNQGDIIEIDARLRTLSHQLFILEAFPSGVKIMDLKTG
ncbi:MAG TPA: hypothetical protein VJ824_08100 [Bacillota bacterium]|nr:hypothetical protein [Bacillota bacterium]